jgi:hypothetical protein
LNDGVEPPDLIANVTRMVGIDPPEWRLRVGDYRARFLVEKHPNESEPAPSELHGVVVVFKVGHRSEIYET